MKKMSFVTTMILLSLAVSAGAQTILWDQTDGYEGWSQGFFNMIAGGPPMGMTMYTVNDVVVPSGGWTVHTYRVIYDGFDAGWAGAVTQATLYVEAKTGAMPTGDPTGGTLVNVTATVLGNGFLEVTCNELDLILAQGEYWMALTPYAPNTNNIHVSVPAVGDDAYSYDPSGFPMPMWGAWVAGYDGAILIEGDYGVVPAEDKSWGDLKSLYR